MVLMRTIKRDLRILILVDEADLSQKEIVVQLNLGSDGVIRDAIKRYRKYKKLYVEQFQRFFPNYHRTKFLKSM